MTEKISVSFITETKIMDIKIINNVNFHVTFFGVGLTPRYSKVYWPINKLLNMQIS